MSSQDKVRVAIIGVGNCASSFVQGIKYYENAKQTDFVPGLMHVNLGGYHIRDIEFSAAFDIDKKKVGQDLSEAIYTWPNCTYKFCQVPQLDIPVHRGMTHDGLGKYLSEIIQKARHQVVRGANPGCRLRLRELHPRIYCPGELLAQEIPGTRAPRYRG
jgi:myo-inositol-1-phosphate synthase